MMYLNIHCVKSYLAAEKMSLQMQCVNNSCQYTLLSIHQVNIHVKKIKTAFHLHTLASLLGTTPEIKRFVLFHLCLYSLVLNQAHDHFQSFRSCSSLLKISEHRSGTAIKTPEMIINFNFPPFKKNKINQH